MTEAQLHKQICDYIKWQYPKALFNTDLSGIKISIGQAKKIKGLRSCNKFPDLVIYAKTVPLFLEIKKECPFNKSGLPKSKHIAEQQEMLWKIQDLGYYGEFAWSFNQAKSFIDNYMNENI